MSPRSAPLGTTRRIRAALVVALIVCAAPCADMADRLLFPATPAQWSGADELSFDATADPLAALDEVERTLDGFQSEVPEGVAEEVGVLPGARAIRVSANGDVVGYVVDEELGRVRTRVRASMAEKGWSEVSLGSVEGATYVKGEGAYRWVLVTCSQAGKATSVVVRCPRTCA